MTTDGGREGQLVLYIDDKPENDVLMRRILSRRPSIDMITARTGADGVMQSLRQRPDLILLDMTLPDFSGEEVLAQLRDEPVTHYIPVVIVTAEAAPSQVRRMLDEGASAYFTMPYDVSAFLSTIDELLGL